MDKRILADLTEETLRHALQVLRHGDMAARNQVLRVILPMVVRQLEDESERDQGAEMRAQWDKLVEEMTS